MSSSLLSSLVDAAYGMPERSASRLERMQKHLKDMQHVDESDSESDESDSDESDSDDEEDIDVEKQRLEHEARQRRMQQLLDKCNVGTSQIYFNNMHDNGKCTTVYL
jgi:hypothetical protein